jgi:hypothetical protein
MATPACCFERAAMTETRDIRLLALWRDDSTEAPMTVDLRIDTTSQLIVGHWDVFGAFDLDGANRRPFILRRDGTIDFGARVSGAHWRTDLRDARIKVGARFHVQWNVEDRGEYEIVKVAMLGAKEGGQ